MARFITVLILFWFGSSISNAQPAPNFIVTTSDGEFLDLYADLLDQDKAVLLEIMFTTCPPCNTMAPYLEPLYQFWGGGNGNVEFISLSDKSFDSNADLAAWKQSYGMTFYGAGEDGGSLDAVAPYKGGNWGPFTGTPTFVVIAPDRSVQFDVRGVTNLSTVDSLTAAIARALDTVLFADPPFVFEGIARLEPPDTNGLEGIEFMLVSDTGSTIPLSASTDSAGYYYLEFEPGTLSEGDYLTLQYSHEVPAYQGITTFDLAIIQRHVLGIALLDDPLELLKADVNRDGAVNILDVIEMRKLILGIYDSWPSGETFILVSTEPVDGPNGTTIPYSTTIPIVSGIFDYHTDFFLLRIGDVR